MESSESEPPSNGACCLRILSYVADGIRPMQSLVKDGHYGRRGKSPQNKQNLDLKISGSPTLILNKIIGRYRKVYTRYSGMNRDFDRDSDSESDNEIDDNDDRNGLTAAI